MPQMGTKGTQGKEQHMLTQLGRCCILVELHHFWPHEGISSLTMVRTFWVYAQKVGREDSRKRWVLSERFFFFFFFSLSLPGKEFVLETTS